MSTWVCTGCGGENPAGMRFCGHCGTPAAVGDPPASEAAVADALRSFVAGPVADKLVAVGGRIPEERRLITALFADVSGFTSLAERLDPEQLLEVIDPVISRLSSIVGRHEGYVEKFAGDALLALFGAPVAHEDDAQRALLVALEMHAELDRLCDELPYDAELTLHVGVNTGHGIARILGSDARTDYAVLGESVILAQRLESAAPPGSTYVSESTFRLTREAFELEPVGELTLKGKADPVPAWRLLGPRTRARTARPTGLIGRRREVEAAVQVIGAGGAVVVVGDPGVGKSRLTEEVRRLTESEGVRWLETRCLSYGAGLAYWPYLQLLRDADVDDPFVQQALGTAPRDEAVREPEAVRRGFHDAVADWLLRLSAERPTVLAIEDLHWADPSSVALTGELVRRAGESALTLYLVARPEAAGVLAELAPEAERLLLQPLAEAAVEELVSAVLAGPPPSGLVPFLVSRAGGNPFFVQELLRSLQESDILTRRAGGWTLRRGWDARRLPVTIEEVLSSRIDLLPPTASSLLQTASVIGRRVDESLLRAVHDDPALDEDLELLVQAGFLDRDDRDGRPVFHHALIQDAAYERLLRRRRRELHLRVAERAEAIYGAGDDAVDLLARHLYLGDAGPRAVGYLLRAGERARGLYANEEAILHLRRARELAPDDDELALTLADLHELVGDYDEAAAVYEQVRQRDRANVRAWCGMASTRRRRGQYLEALAVVDEAFGSRELRGRDLSPLWLQAGWSLSVAGHYDAGIDVLEAGLETAPDPAAAVVGELLLQLAQTEILEGKHRGALEHARRAAAIFEGASDLRGLTASERVAGDAERELGNLDDAAAALRRGLELARRTGSVEEIGGCLLNLGRVELERGALADAIECDRAAIEEFERIGHGSGRAAGYANLAEKLILAGELDAAIEHCDRAETLAREMGNSLVLADALRTRALALLRRGSVTDAAAVAEASAALFAEIEVWPEAATALELAAEAFAGLGEAERAQSLRDRARTFS